MDNKFGNQDDVREYNEVSRDKSDSSFLDLILDHHKEIWNEKQTNIIVLSANTTLRKLLSYHHMYEESELWLFLHWVTR